MKKIILSSIRIYQKTSKPLYKNLFHIDTFCRYTPTCSEYTYQAIQKYGVVKGTLVGLVRIARCNPLSKGGNDPVK